MTSKEYIEITCISEYINVIEKIIENNKNEYIDNDRIIWVYRGEPELYDTKLMPSLFRSNSADILKYEKNLLDTVLDENVVEDNYMKKILKSIDSQHYTATSRLLDISYNPLKALYFALEFGDSEKDAYVYMFCFEEHFSANSEYISQFYEDILNNIKFPFMSNSHKLIRFNRNNLRINAQDGGFILFPGSKYYDLSDKLYTSIKIDKTYINKLKSDLENIFGYSLYTIYPEKDKLDKKITSILEKGSYINICNIFEYKYNAIELMFLEYKIECNDIIRNEFLKKAKKKEELERLSRYTIKKINNEINDIDKILFSNLNEIKKEELRKEVKEKLQIYKEKIAFQKIKYIKEMEK